MTDTKINELTSQMDTLPGIIGRLGVNIATAQKELDKNFVDNIIALSGLIKSTIGTAGNTTPDEALKLMNELLKSIAPSRYQFTETSFDLKVDLSESSRSVTAGSGSINLKAIALSAAMSRAYGYDYQAAARVSCVIHARPVGEAISSTLLERAQSLGEPTSDSVGASPTSLALATSAKQLWAVLNNSPINKTPSDTPDGKSKEGEENKPKDAE